MEQRWSANKRGFTLFSDSSWEFLVKIEGTSATYCVRNGLDDIQLLKLDILAVLGIPEDNCLYTCHDSIYNRIYNTVDRKDWEKLADKERVKLALMTFWRTTCDHTTDNIASHPNIIYAFGYEFWKENVYPHKEMIQKIVMSAFQTHDIPSSVI